jgi:hypothetical protein
MLRHALAPAAVVCALLAGCSQSEEPGPGTTGQEPASGSEAEAPSAPAAAPGAPAITEAEAQQVLETYNKKNNRANAKLNSKLLKTIETEAAFALDNAVYRIGHKLDPDNEDPIQAYEWVDPEFHIPALPEDAEPWFVAEASTDSSPDKRDLMLFTSKGGGKPWKMALYARLDEPLPELATDANGAAITVDPAEAAGLHAAPTDSAEAHAAYLTSGEDSPEAAGLDTHEMSQQIVENAGQLQQSFAEADSLERDVTVTDHPVRALQTADGGAVAFYATKEHASVRTEDSVLTVRTPEVTALGAKDVVVTPSGDEAFLIGMDLTWLSVWITAIPAEGGGELSVLGANGRMANVTGVDPSEYPEDMPPEVEALLPDRT